MDADVRLFGAVATIVPDDQANCTKPDAGRHQARVELKTDNC